MNESNRRQWLASGLVRAAGLAAFAGGLPFKSSAQNFPWHPIRILVGNGAGGTTDLIARLYGTKLSEMLGTPVLVDDKPGGFQLPAIRGLLRAPRDGHTLFLGNASSLSLAPGVREDVGYAPMTDFTFVAEVGSSSGVFCINNELPVRSMLELVEHSIANPGKINYGSAGVGASNHLKIEYLKTLTGMQATHIPYKSDTEILRETIAGNIHMCLLTVRAAQPNVLAGKLRALAVTAPRSLRHLPGVPGTSEIGIKELEALEPYTYFGLVGPAGMPTSTVTKLNEAVNKVSEMPDVRARMREFFFLEPSTGTPAYFQDMNRRELAKAVELGRLITPRK